MHWVHRATPLPNGIDQELVLERMDPAKDADGLHPVNLGRLVLGLLALCRAPRVESLSCSVAITSNSMAPRCVVGRGVTVGRPLGLLPRAVARTQRSRCVTPERATSRATPAADVVVAAAGVPGLITADMVKSGAAVLDVGLRGPMPDSLVMWRLMFTKLRRLSHRCPGVGPMTRAMLLANVVERAEQLAAFA